MSPALHTEPAIPKDPIEKDISIFLRLKELEERMTHIEEYSESVQSTVEERSKEMVETVRSFLQQHPTPQQHVSKENTMSQNPTPAEVTMTRRGIDLKKAAGYAGAFAVGAAAGYGIHKVVVKRRQSRQAAMDSTK